MPDRSDYGTVIVGAGHAGSQLAATLRQEGYAEPILLVGREPDLPYHRPPLSKAFLKAADDKIQPLRGDRFYADNMIDFRPGRSVDRIDLAGRSVTLDDGSVAVYGKLALATGATPRWPDLPGNRLGGLMALRNVADARGLRARLSEIENVVVLGGGFIGLEMAATLSHLGKHVTVLELGDRLLGRAVSPAISAHVANRLAASGIVIQLGTSASAVLGETAVTAVRTTEGRELLADLVVFGIGVTPDTDLAEQAGLDCKDGILVDAAMCTPHPDVFAIGDCARFDHWHAGRSVRLESVQNATDQARLVAGAIMGKQAAYAAVPWFWSDIGDMKLQMAGLSFDADRHVITGSPAENAFSVYHFSGPRLIAIDSVNKPADHMIGRRMLASGYDPAPALVESGEVNQAFKTWAAKIDAAQAESV